MTDRHLVVFGLGYSGTAIARAALQAGFTVAATTRDPAGVKAPPGIEVVRFDKAEQAVAHASHVIATAPPGEDGDPVLHAYRDTLQQSRHLVWAGYLSTTGVYGDRNGGWVDETTAPAPTAQRAWRRLHAEQDWSSLARHVAVDLFRVAGIYGPGRSVFDDLRSGHARRILKPGHAFGRIHRDDIAGAVVAAALHPPGPGVRVLHLADDFPAESADVIEEAARLLGMAPPGAVTYAEAEPAMSDMARSFWAENRKVSSAISQKLLDYRWRYPGYREGLASILAEEASQRAQQQ